MNTLSEEAGPPTSCLVLYDPHYKQPLPLVLRDRPQTDVSRAGHRCDRHQLLVYCSRSREPRQRFLVSAAGEVLCLLGCQG